MYETDLLFAVCKLEEKKMKRVSAKDLKLAKKINFEEYENNNQLIECQICYNELTFEGLVQCSEMHLTCHRCVLQLITQTLTGENESLSEGIKCVCSTECLGIIPNAQVIKAVGEKKFKELNFLITKRNIEKSNVFIVNCPFCYYCEVDDKAVFKKLNKKKFVVLIFLAGFTGCFWLSFIAMVLWGFIALVLLIELLYKQLDLSSSLSSFAAFCEIRNRVSISNNLLECKNPECMKLSCTLCHKQAVRYHECYYDDKEKLRLQIEQAKSDALKRTCPRCFLSFTKLDGCNKMTCNCGYKMCYVCRKDINKEKYDHFCKHFREIPGTRCTLCTKCDLYADPDTGMELYAAELNATKEFLKTSELSSTNNTLFQKKTINNFLKGVFNRIFSKLLDWIYYY